MILYIPLEVYTREIKAHLLLATIAVSRGYEVLIASPSNLWMYKRLNLLPRGNYLIKNMNIPSNSESQYNSYIKDGFDLYCQEQEPSILHSSFKDFIKLMKINSNQSLPFKAVFCWGDRGTNGYKNLFSSKSSIFYNTGSPRSDLWTNKYLSLREPNYIKNFRPYILFVLNFGGAMGMKHWTSHIKTLFGLELIKKEEDLIDFINEFKEDSSICFEMILTIKNVSIKFPNLNIVIRPHPVSNLEYWKALFTNNKNVIVSSNEDSLSSWISNSQLVVHNGCTSAIETVIQNIPLISHGPSRDICKANIPNSLGKRTKTFIELESAINDVINNKDKNIDQLESKNILNNLISFEMSNSSNLILDIISSKSVANLEFKFSYLGIIMMRISKKVKSILDKFRRLFGNQTLKDVNYEINKTEVENTVKIISKIHNINHPKIEFISKTAILLKK